MTRERKHIQDPIESDKAVEVQRPIATSRAEHSVWADVAAEVKERITAIEAPPPPAVEEEVPKKGEMTAEEEREWNEKLLAAGRYCRERKTVWGIDRKISPKIRVTENKRIDKHIDSRVENNNVKHRIRRPASRKIHRGVGRIKGVNPFRKGV